MIVRTKEDELIEDLLESVNLSTYGLECTKLNDSINLDDTETELIPQNPNPRGVPPSWSELARTDLNRMNLPISIDFYSNKVETKNISYLYIVNGEKLRVKAINTTDCIGNFVYKEGELSYILMPEGCIVIDNTVTERSQSATFNYFLTYRLGNIRAIVNQNNELIESNSYYPFGMCYTEPVEVQIKNLSTTVSDPENKYLYNGKELVDDFGLDWYEYGFRMYAPQIARFPSLDPKADEFAFVSPYNYAENRPIDCIDLWGLQKVGANRIDQNPKRERMLKNRTELSTHHYNTHGATVIRPETRKTFWNYEGSYDGGNTGNDIKLGKIIKNGLRNGDWNITSGGDGVKTVNADKQEERNKGDDANALDAFSQSSPYGDNGGGTRVVFAPTESSDGFSPENVMNIIINNALPINETDEKITTYDNGTVTRKTDIVTDSSTHDGQLPDTMWRKMNDTIFMYIKTSKDYPYQLQK